MNLLDENIIESQRRELRDRGVSIRQIGVDVGRKGMKDGDIIRLLHQRNRVTFFTRDDDFYTRRLCHQGYCLVYLDVDDDEVAEFVRRTLRHREFNTRAKRMGTVIRVSLERLHVWRKRAKREETVHW